MKLRYEKPMLEVDNYELDTSIASNCGYVISSGPMAPGHDPCQDYYDLIGMPMPNSVDGPKYNIDFYEGCDCYYSSSGFFFTS